MEPQVIRSDDKTAIFRIRLDIYGLEPILKAAHRFTGKCILHLDRDSDGYVLCKMTKKSDIYSMETITGEFLNEALDQTLRARLLAQTEPLRNLLIAQAFSRTNLLESPAALAESGEDPLGIEKPDVPH